MRLCEILLLKIVTVLFAQRDSCNIGCLKRSLFSHWALHLSEGVKVINILSTLEDIPLDHRMSLTFIMEVHVSG